MFFYLCHFSQQPNIKHILKEMRCKEEKIVAQRHQMQVQVWESNVYAQFTFLFFTHDARIYVYKARLFTRSLPALTFRYFFFFVNNFFFHFVTYIEVWEVET